MGFINLKYLYIYLSIVIGGGGNNAICLHSYSLLCNGICSIKVAYSNFPLCLGYGGGGGGEGFLWISFILPWEFLLNQITILIYIGHNLCQINVSLFLQRLRRYGWNTQKEGSLRTEKRRK